MRRIKNMKLELKKETMFVGLKKLHKGNDLFTYSVTEALHIGQFDLTFTQDYIQKG